MQEVGPATRAYGGQPASTPRDRDPNCIEQTLNTIEANLEEVINSSANLADKIRPELQKNGAIQQAAPTCGDLSSRLAAIENSIRFINQNLGRAHMAISG